MNSTSKGVVSVVLGFFAFFSIGVLDYFHVRLGVSITLGGSFLCSALALYFGIKARRGGAKIIGLAGVVLGVIGVAIFSVNILAVIASKI